MSLADYYVGETASEFEDDDDEVTSFADDTAEHDETDVLVSDNDDDDDNSSVSSSSTGQPFNYMTLSKNIYKMNKYNKKYLYCKKNIHYFRIDAP